MTGKSDDHVGMPPLWLIDDIMHEAAELQMADWPTIMRDIDAWNVKHNPAFGQFSISKMDYEELTQAIVEDLLNVHQWALDGKDVSFRPDDFKRMVPPEMHDRIDAALADPFVMSLVVIRDDQIRIHPHHLQDAMDFCGVWLEGYEPVPSDLSPFRGGMR